MLTKIVVDWKSEKFVTEIMSANNFLTKFIVHQIDYP